MKYFKNLFAKNKTEDTGPSEVAVRAAEIKSRIDAFYRNYSWSNQPQTPTPVTIENETKHKPSEADILKAKLLGKKL